MNKESFVFYKSFYEAIKNVPEEEQLKLYNSIFKYQFEGEEIKLSGKEKAICVLINTQIDKQKWQKTINEENTCTTLCNYSKPNFN